MTDNELYEHNSIRKYIKWRKRVNKGLPSFANRVFALRNTGYMGCGFHYDLERQLGNLINGVNRTDREAFDFTYRIALKVLCSGLYKDIIRIENELNNKEYGNNRNTRRIN